MSEEVVSTAPQETPAGPETSTAADTPHAEGVPAQKPAAEAPAETPAGDKPAETKTDEQPEKPGQSRFQRRLDRAYKAKAEAEARAEFFQRQAEEFRRANAPPQAPLGAPRQEDFDDVQKYAQAYADFQTQERFKQVIAAQQQQAAQQQTKMVADAWAEKSGKGESKYEDFEETVGDLKPITPWARAIMRSENGEDIAYYLGKNMKEAARIVALDPEAQYLEVGRLSAKLLAEPQKPKLPSNAPAPIKPVGGSESPSTKKLSELSQDEFEKRRRQQIAARR